MSLRAPAPIPATARPNLLRLLAILKDNPLLAWTTAHFERPLVHESLPFMRAVVISEPAAIQRVLLENVSNYHKDDLLLRILSPALSNGLLTVDGEQWRRQRRAVAPMFARKAITGYAPAMKEAADALVRRWMNNGDGATLDIAQESTDATLEVLQRTIFSQGLGRSTDEFRAAMRLYFDSIGRLDPFDILGLPAILPRWTKRRARPAIAFFDDAVKSLILERKWLLAEEPENCPNDILTLLLEARDPETGEGLTTEELRANVVTLIAAGHETTANALTWSLYLLSRDRSWRERVAAEARHVLAGPPELAPDRLVAARAVIDEALRLYPSIAAISRVTSEADELCGEQIRAGTLVIVPPYVVHRHRLLWDRPDEFDPSRFFGANRQHIHRYAYLPFGAGPRICLGAAFALQEATILLATITAHFVLELANDREPEPLLRITLRPRGGLPMLVNARYPDVSRAMLFARERGRPPRIRMAS